MPSLAVTIPSLVIWALIIIVVWFILGVTLARAIPDRLKSRSRRIYVLACVITGPILWLVVLYDEIESWQYRRGRKKYDSTR